MVYQMRKLFFTAGLLLPMNASEVSLGEEDPNVPTRSTFFGQVKIPVDWQLTISRRQSLGAASVTEHYQEDWILEFNQDHRMQLVSRRARVPVFTYGPGLESDLMPRRIGITEYHLGRLLGVFTASSEIYENNGSQERTLELVLQNRSKDANEFVLHFSEDEHFTVLLKFTRGH